MMCPQRVVVRSALVLAAPVVLALGCARPPPHEVTIVDGAGTVHFAVRSAFAEYLELPGERNELRLTLASYAVSCERWRPPRAADVALTVIVVTPSDIPPTATTYGWSGVPAGEEPFHTPYALPKAEFGDRSRLFEPGGAIRITGLQIDPHGSVSGTLAFEFPGDSDRPATRIDGGFDAKMCRLALAQQ